MTRGDHLRAVIADPDGDAPRLAFAEWCEANGEADRGEFIRLQIERAERTEMRPADGWATFAWGLPSSWVTPPVVRSGFFTDRALLDRTSELRKAHNEWLAELPPDWPNEFTEHERGFVRALDISPAQLLADPGRYFDAAPVCELQLTTQPDRPWARPDVAPALAAVPHLSRVRKLSFGVFAPDTANAFVRAFVTSPHASNLTDLDIGGKHLEPAVLSAVAGSSFLGNLRSLVLRGNPLEPESLGLLASTPRLPNLRHLGLGGCRLTGESVRALLGGELFARLDTLDIDWNETLGADGASVLAASPHLARVRCLNLDHCGLGQAGCEPLARSRFVRDLEVLSLGTNDLGAGVTAVFASAAFASLHTLKLTRNRFTPEVVAAFGRCAPPALRRLDLSYCALGDGGAAALAASPLARQLTHLRLYQCDIGDAGAAALAAGDNFSALREIDLSSNPLTDAGAEALAAGPGLRGVWRLRILCEAITDRGVLALAELPGLGRNGLSHGVSRMKKAAERRLKELLDSRPDRARDRPAPLRYIDTMSFADTLDILFEDNHCLALNKPAGWPTTHFDGTDETVDRLAKSYLKEKFRKPGNVFLGVVHRLDKPVTGVLLFARTSKAAARLSEQFREGAVEKAYWAVAADAPRAPWGASDSGSLEDWLSKDDDAARVEVVDKDAPGAKFARLLFTVKARVDGLAWLELSPRTGRKHQLRVQLGSRGFPIYGDTKYGSAKNLAGGIGLHARALTFLHPTTKEPITLTADVPKHWRGRFARLMAAT